MKPIRIAVVTLVALAFAAPAAPAATTTKLVATVGPNFNISLTKAGKKVTTLKPGTYSITVRDRSNFHNFHLRGPGRVNKATGIGAVTTKVWTVRLVRGTYRYVCDPHATMMKGSFTVR
jgi:plastocyanin